MAAENTTLDVAALREKYNRERNKRDNPRHNDQWTDLDDRFAHLAEDPYVEPGFTRAPIVEDMDVLVIGGGFGGLISGVELKKIGLETFRIVEKAGDFGGTWYWNRYPGAQCDTESYVYLPFLEETGYVPTEKYVFAPEMLEHSQRIGRHFGLYDHAIFQTQVIDMRWDEAERFWTVSTNRGDILRARFVISGSGPLNRVKLPGIPGIADFGGHIFHTSRWDYAYTGGSSDGRLTKLADKRVAIIGTGATAIQCVPRVAHDAGHLYVVQRTPSVVGERGNRPTDMDWARSLEPGWQYARSTNFESHVLGIGEGEDMVADGWTFLNRSIRPERTGTPLPVDEYARQAEIRDMHAGELMRSRVTDIVKDPATAAALQPWYRIYCKRPTFNDEYYPAFNQPNVTLIDSEGEGVERITKTGLVVKGVEYEVDCIIFATGFETGTEYTKRSEFEVQGVDGLTLTDHFKQGSRTLHGFYAHGFPNFLILGVSQNAFTASFTHMLLDQADHLIALIRMMKDRGLTRVEPSAQAVEAWQDVIREKAKGRIAFLATCTPGYYNGYGKLDTGLFTNGFNGAGGCIEFKTIIDDWWAKDNFAGLDFD